MVGGLKATLQPIAKIGRCNDRAGLPTKPIRRVTLPSNATVVAWVVQPGQRITPHVHPHGQGTWMVTSGAGEYQVDAQGRTVLITAGDVVIAAAGEVHGVLCTSPEPLVFMSVVCPAEAGYAAL